MPTDTVRLIDERDQIRKENPDDPRIQELNNNINHMTKEHRQEKWIDHLKDCGQGTKKLWDTIKGINNPPENLKTRASSSMTNTTINQRN